jgi:hypothetical protein
VTSLNLILFMNEKLEENYDNNDKKSSHMLAHAGVGTWDQAYVTSKTYVFTR